MAGDRRGLPHRLFVAAIGLAAVHAADDAFVHLEPGVTPGDHLLAGVVVLAVLGGALAAWLRLADGWRGSIALALAAPAALGFALAVTTLARDGGSGDEWTGLLLLPAAAGFVTAGAAVL